MRFFKLFCILLFYISACSTNHRNPILEQEYLKNEKENFWLINGLKRQIDNIGNRPLDVEISDRLEQLYQFKYTLSFQSEKDELFPEKVTNDDISKYKDELNKIFIKTKPDKEEIEKWNAVMSEVGVPEEYNEYLTSLILISRLENQIIDRSMMLIGVDDCFFCFGMYVGFNPLEIGQENTVILTITDFYYLHTTICSFRNLKIANLKNSQVQEIETKMVGNMMEIKFIPMIDGTYEISGIMDVQDKASGHTMNYDFRRELNGKDR